jgi:hypothetical protein
VYLTQLLFINLLVWLHWERLTTSLTWPVLCLLTLPIVYLSSFALTALLARTPLAMPLTGRKQVPWATLLPRRAPAAEEQLPLTPAMAGAAIDENG